MDTLIAHITFNLTTGTYTFIEVNQIMGTDAYVISFSPNPDPRQAWDISSDQGTKITIFPYTGAAIFLEGL